MPLANNSSISFSRFDSTLSAEESVVPFSRVVYCVEKQLTTLRAIWLLMGAPPSCNSLMASNSLWGAVFFQNVPTGAGCQCFKYLLIIFIHRTHHEKNLWGTPLSGAAHNQYHFLLPPDLYPSTAISGFSKGICCKASSAEPKLPNNWYPSDMRTDLFQC